MKKLGLLLIIWVLVSCAPQPTPEIVEVTVPVEVTVLVTQPPKVVRETVLVTQPPLPTHTPYPTYTPLPKSTATPKPTATPEPTATATPLPTPVVPEGWQAYESLDGSFTVAYPGSWGIEQEGVSSVIFRHPGPTTSQVSFIERGAMLFGEDDEENVRVVVTQLADVWGKEFLWKGFKVMDKGVWKGSVYKGYFCEYVVYKEEFLEEDTPSRSRSVRIPVRDSTVSFSYGRVASEDFTAEEYETIETMLETIRVKR